MSGKGDHTDIRLSESGHENRGTNGRWCREKNGNLRGQALLHIFHSKNGDDSDRRGNREKFHKGWRQNLEQPPWF